MHDVGRGHEMRLNEMTFDLLVMSARRPTVAMWGTMGTVCVLSLSVKCILVLLWVLDQLVAHRQLMMTMTLSIYLIDRSIA